MNSRSFSGVVDESVNVFCCYSRQDEELRRELVEHLSGLINSGSITIWHDRLIEPGSNWQNEIEDRLNTADIVLLLVSARFLASRYCYNNEMSLALERHRRGEVCVIPIILRSCDWRYETFSNLQALPTDGRPVVRQGCSIDDSLNDVAREIRRVVESMRNRRQALPSRPINIQPPPRRSWLNRITTTLRILLFRRPYRFSRQAGLTIISLLVILWFNHPHILKLFYQPTIIPNVEKFTSFGEKTLLDEKPLLYLVQHKSVKAKYYYDQKSLGMEVFRSNKNYKQAVEIFDHIREDAKSVVEKYSNDTSDNNIEKKAALLVLKDPEILIFRNNAQARQNHIDLPESTLYTIAVAAPMKKHPAMHILHGVAQAQDQAVSPPKDSKLVNLNLQVLIADDGNDESQAKNIANELANNRKDVIAVVGHYASSSTCSALPHYSEGNLVVISPGSTMFGIRSKCGDNNKVFFRTVSSTKVEAESLVNYLLDKSGKPKPKVVVFFNSEEEYSISINEQFQKLSKDNGIITVHHRLSLPNFSLSQYLEEMKTADALAVFPDGQTVDNNNSFIRVFDVIKDKFAPQLILGGNSLYLMETLNQLKSSELELNNRLIIAVDWHPKQLNADYKADPKANVFAMQAETYWYGDVNYRTAMAYEATKILVKMLQSGVRNDRSSIKDKLSKFSPENSVVSDSTVSFDNGDRKETITRVLVTPSKNPTNIDQNNSEPKSEPKFCIVNSPGC
ncbi:TIR domain-containing protein [Nostoc sp. UIC 10890]